MEGNAEQQDSREPRDELFDRKDEWEAMVRRLKAAKDAGEGITLSPEEVDVLLLALVASAKALIANALRTVRQSDIRGLLGLR